MIYLRLKRFIDIFISAITLFFLLPFLLLFGVLIKLTSPGPIFYKGVRAGLNNQSFNMLKFRSMIVDAESKGGHSTAIDDPRFTTIGRFLRKYKIDELPQFINVLKGEMSLVGPRPQVLYYTDKYQGENKKILTVRPGITDLASLYFSDMDSTLGTGDVDRKYETEIEPLKNRLRVRYVNECSFLLDLRILIETAFNIIGIRNSTKLNLLP